MPETVNSVSGWEFASFVGGLLGIPETGVVVKLQQMKCQASRRGEPIIGKARHHLLVGECDGQFYLFRAGNRMTAIKRGAMIVPHDLNNARLQRFYRSIFQTNAAVVGGQNKVGNGQSVKRRTAVRRSPALWRR